VNANGFPRGATSAPGAYIHVPFCAHRCAYCSFIALEGRKEEKDFFEGVEREIRSRRGEAAGHGGPSIRGFDSVYFGGGTPSYVGAHRLGRVLTTLEEIFGFSSNGEITVEANPDDLDVSGLQALQDLGVNRLSIGVQSLVDAELAPLERRHDATTARRAVSDAVRTFGNVSADLMIGIPGQTTETLLASVDGLLSCGISHLSVYLLELEKAPRLVALKTERPELFPDDEEMADRWEAVDERLSVAGLPRYELSNWARPGFESRHNLKYWTLTPVLGFGVGAHSYDGRTRYANTGMLSEYLRRTREGLSTAVTSEETREDFLRRKEGLMLGLRISSGVPSSTFEEIRKSLSSDSASRMEDAFLAGLLETTEGRVRLTRRGVLLSNEVFCLLV
jgi:putative oxygen-independent coproporphyrinogen III oxidase